MEKTYKPVKVTEEGNLDESALLSEGETMTATERRGQVRKGPRPFVLAAGALLAAQIGIALTSAYLTEHDIFKEDKVSSNYTDADGTRVSRVTYDDAHVMELLNGENTNGSRFDYDGNGTWDKVDLTRTSGNATTYEKVDPSLFEVAAKTFWAHHRN